MEAFRLCENAKVDFASAFRYQYVASPKPMDVPGFSATTVGGYYIYFGPDLRSRPLIDGSGATFGLVLGIAVDHDGRTAEDALKAVIANASAATAQEALERYLAKLAGRYAIFVTISGRLLFYCDPVGMIGAVYAAETRRIGSSPTLCIDRPYEDNPRYNIKTIADGKGMYGFDHTRDLHVFRMNANHRLDLVEFVTTRFWPRDDDVFGLEQAEYGSAFDEIIAAERRIIDRITTLGTTVIPLSGGNDSRMILALTAAETRKRVALYYTHINNYSGRRDADLGQKLASRLDLPHEKHDHKTAKTDPAAAALAAKAYAIASGGLGACPAEIANGLYQLLPKDAIILRGHQCNILRAQYVRFADPERWTDPMWHIRWMRLLPSESFGPRQRRKFVPDFMRFYNDIPKSAQARSADFFFFEALVPAALGHVFPGLSHAFYMSPFNSRRLVQLVMGFDTAYRMSNNGTHDLLMRAEPLLCTLPFLADLEADMTEGPEQYKKRMDRLADAAERYQHWFAQDVPAVAVECDARQSPHATEKAVTAGTA